MATTPTIHKIQLKLLVNTYTYPRKVIFAEAGKDFVDFLFGLLELPVGSILSLMRNCGMDGSGSWAKVYESVRNLDEEYMQSSNTKKSLLKPKIAVSCENSPTPLLKQLANRIYASEYQLLSDSALKGHVKGAVTYMVMDDLTVKPLSTFSITSLISSMGIPDLSFLQEKTVEIDMLKGLELAKASFVSTNVLTNVLLQASQSSCKRERNACTTLHWEVLLT